jgi:non-heme chloroperoxidase
MLSSILTNDGTVLFVKDWGHGHPVVFLSGWSLNADAWHYQMVPLVEQGLRCVAYDRRGHGRSSQPGSGYDYDTLADDLAAVLTQLDLRAVTLIGHSMASGEIVRYLSRHGASRIARTVLLAPTTPFVLQTADNPHGVPQALFDQQRAAMKKDFPAYVTGLTPAFFPPETSAAMTHWVVSLSLQCSLKAAIECMHAFSETDFRAEMRTITVPTLIIHGDADVSTPLDLTGRPSAQLIPGAQLTVYEGAPHGLMFSHMERLNNDLLTFIAR